MPGYYIDRLKRQSSISTIIYLHPRIVWKRKNHKLVLLWLQQIQTKILLYWNEIEIFSQNN